jgi:hypothetical protein
VGVVVDPAFGIRDTNALEVSDCLFSSVAPRPTMAERAESERGWK